MMDKDPQPSSSNATPLYVFACAVAWTRGEDCEAGRELMALVNDPNPEIRVLVRALLSYVRALTSLELLDLLDLKGRIHKGESDPDEPREDAA